MAAATATAHSIAINTRRRVLGDVNPDWHPNVSNYATDFTKKPTVGQTGRSPLPIHDNRKNNPHPSHLAHLRRLSNEPVCTVKTMVSQTAGDGAAHCMESSMRTHYPTMPPSPEGSRPTRFGCNPAKKVAAVGIVPTTPEPDPDTERLLPASQQHTTLMTTKNPFSYVPRRRKIVPIGIGMYVTPPTPIVIHPSSQNTASRKMQATPIPIDEGFTLSDPQPGDSVQVGKTSSPRRPRRRHVASAPKTTLQVDHFDGGAPTDTTRTITGRKKKHIPNLQILGDAKLPVWLNNSF